MIRNIICISEKTDPSIVWMKFFAAIFITLSHVTIMVPPAYKLLVSGGALGNAMFFYCSGLTLFKGRNDGFINWYGRRINRIYPTVIVWFILYSLFFGYNGPVYSIITADFPNGYWFIPIIMIYYFIFYFVRKYIETYIKLFFLLVFLGVSILSFIMIDSEHRMYATMKFMYVANFLFMLLGAIISKLNLKSHSFWLSLFLAVAGFGGYYVCMGLYRYVPFTCKFQLVSLIILLLSMIGFYKFFGCKFMSDIIVKKTLFGKIIYFASTLTLEIYMLQGPFWTDKFNSIFPLNILLVYILIIAMSYVLHCLARLFSTIFGGKVFDRQYIFSV